MSEYMNVWIWSTVNSHLTTLVGSIWHHHPTGKEQFFHWPFILLMSKAPICVKGDPKGAGWKGAAGTGHHLPKRKATGEVAHWKTDNRGIPTGPPGLPSHGRSAPQCTGGLSRQGEDSQPGRKNQEAAGKVEEAVGQQVVTAPAQVDKESHPLWAQTTLSKEPGARYFPSLNLSIPHV